MGIDGNYRRIVGNYRKINLIQGSHPPWRKKEIKKEKCTNALKNWFILPLISNVELQSYTYRILALMSLVHIAQIIG